MTLIDSTPRTAVRPDADPGSRGSAQPGPLGGSYVTTRRTTPRAHATTGTYVSSRNPASAVPGSYVTTSPPSVVSGGRYTYTG